MTRNRARIVLYILCVWFVISFVTNIIGPLMPIIIRDFDLSLSLAGVLPFSFFMAYGVVSIPAGMMIERVGPKATLLAAFMVNFAGALWFALFPSYLVVVAALFVIGAGMAMLQVVINPLMRTAGGEAHFAFFSVLAQLVFGLASFLSPLAFSALMQTSSGSEPQGGVVTSTLAWLAPNALPWVSFYWGFAAIFMIVIVGTAALQMPLLHLKADERAGTAAVYRELLRHRHVRLFFLGIVAYVGTEQILANWMSQFLSTYHGVSPTLEGAHAVAAFWGLMSLGCLFGLSMLKLLDSKVVLGMFSACAIVCAALALFGTREIALFAFPMTGFFLSVMFSVVFSLALNSTREHHGALSGILCTGILGGALLPLLVGMLGDWLGLRAAMSMVFLSLGYVLAISLWADPIIRNDTVSISTLLGWARTGRSVSNAGERPT
jgi:MFS transporter, FHS family, L-fucose permease